MIDPMMLLTDNDRMTVVIRQRDDTGMCLPPDLAPFIAQIEVFGRYDQQVDEGKLLAVIPLTPDHVRRIRAAFTTLLDQHLDDDVS